jgi:small conductance mechanosensitive channel
MRHKRKKETHLNATALREQAIDAARRSRRRLIVLIPLTAAVLIAYFHRQQLFGADTPVRIAAAAVLAFIGWSLAQNVARAIQPRLERRLEPGTSGVVGFLLRLATITAAVLFALRLAGIQPNTLLAGAGFTAVVLGLAAQQTFGNIFAGIVLLSARPFKVGDRVRFRGFGMDVEGTVASQGLLYVTMREGDDLVLVPNNTALTMSARPMREPAAVDMRARMPYGVDPESVEQELQHAVSVSTRGKPQIELEEFDGDDVVLRVKATPQHTSDGGRLAREVLGAIGKFASERGDGQRMNGNGVPAAT